jgi:hypothetical protein
MRIRPENPDDFRGGRALPYMTNQQMNRCLKDLCEICGFNTPYTITYYKNGLPIYWEADIFELWANVLIDFSRTR